MLSTIQKTKVQQALLDPDMPAAGLLALLIDNYDTEFLSWDFDTLRMELADDFHANLPDINEQKIQAVMTALTTDAFFRDPMVFQHIAKALSNEPVDMDSFTPLEPDEAAWAAFEVLSLVGKEHPPFSDEVRNYVGMVLTSHGIHHAPKTLGFATMDTPEPGILADDPELYAGFHKHNSESSQALDQHVQQKFNRLMDVLASLPLEHRDDESWSGLVKKLSGSPNKQTV